MHLQERAPTVSHDDLREMLREQERVINHQIRALAEQDGESKHMIKLCVAALAGGVALASVLLRDPTDVTPMSILPIGLAAALNLISLVGGVRPCHLPAGSSLSGVHRNHFLPVTHVGVCNYGGAVPSA